MKEVEENPNDTEILARLLTYLNKPGQIQLLCELLEDLDRSSRYGDITLVVADGRVQRIRQSRSF